MSEFKMHVDPRPVPKLARCECPTMIVIPAGEHIHVKCPLHGDVIIYGPSYSYSYL